MGALTKNKEVPRKAGELESLAVEDNVRIYKGAQVCVNASGYAEPATNVAGKRFVGIAYEECDNTIAGHTQGGKRVRVYRIGVFRVVASSITQAMLGQMLYVVDDQTVDDAIGNGVRAGILVDYESATSGWIAIVSDSGQGARTADAPEVTSADATNEATCITLANEIKADYNNARTLINELKALRNLYK